MGFTVDRLLGSLDLTDLGANRYRGTNIDTGHAAVFGGQLLAQSMVAASAGNPNKAVKTLHTVFVRAGDPAAPLDIDVEPLHAGRSMASSTVTIRQGDRLVARSQVLLSADEPDLIQHADQPRAPLRPPEAPEGRGGWEVGVVGDVDVSDPGAVGPPVLDVWTRFVGAPDDPRISQAMLAYATDGFLIGTAMRPHPGVGQAQAHRTLSRANSSRPSFRTA